MSADVCFLRFKYCNCSNKFELKIERALNLKDAEKEVNKGVIAFTDDTKVLRVLKMRTD